MAATRHASDVATLQKDELQPAAIPENPPLEVPEARNYKLFVGRSRRSKTRFKGEDVPDRKLSGTVVGVRDSA
ncbi:hypothetical protein Tco_0246143 [Tanacetum coccineum]